MESEISFVLFIIIEATFAGDYTHEKLVVTLTYCPVSLCDVIIINNSGREGNMHDLECASTCEEDSACLLFHFISIEDECHICTKEISGHRGAIQIANVTSYSDIYADIFVYKRDAFFKNTGQLF